MKIVNFLVMGKHGEIVVLPFPWGCCPHGVSHSPPPRHGVVAPLHHPAYILSYEVTEMKQKIPPGREVQQKPDVLFCTECGATLDEFCFSSTAKDIKAIRENFARCKHSGKFQGEGSDF